MNIQPTIQLNPAVTADQLFEFYVRNDICEAGLGKETAARILDHPHLMVAAFAGDQLIGLARATFDGLSAHIMEFSLDLAWQGRTKHRNGSLLEADSQGLGAAMGARLLSELKQRGCSFVSGYIVNNCEEAFYRALGFTENKGHTVFCIDQRPYANGGG